MSWSFGQVIKVISDSKYNTNFCNVGGSSGDSLPAGYRYTSWLEAWYGKTGTSSQVYCYACRNKPAEVGGHVALDTIQECVFIVPLCSVCNNPTHEDSHCLKPGDKLLPLNGYRKGDSDSSSSSSPSSPSKPFNGRVKDDYVYY